MYSPFPISISVYQPSCLSLLLSSLLGGEWDGINISGCIKASAPSTFWRAEPLMGFRGGRQRANRQGEWGSSAWLSSIYPTLLDVNRRWNNTVILTQLDWTWINLKISFSRLSHKTLQIFFWSDSKREILLAASLPRKLQCDSAAEQQY